MKEYHNCLDEYSHDLHGIVEISKVTPLKGLKLLKDTHQISINGIGLGIKTGDVIVYNPDIWRSVRENDNFPLIIAGAQVIKIGYETGDSA